MPSANVPGCDFPIQNLPFGVFRGGGSSESRVGVAIGDGIVDVGALAKEGLLATLEARVVDACRAPALNDLMTLGVETWSELRRVLSGLLSG